MPSVVLINDTSLYAPHFGCQLVGQTIREQLARTGTALIAAFPRKLNMSIARPYLDRADLVIINAEGTFHHGRHTELLDLARRWPCALINGVFQDNGDLPILEQFEYISMRESLSAAEVRSQGVLCKRIPDLLFASSMLRSVPNLDRDMELGITDNVLNKMSGFSPNGELAYESLKKIARCQKLCAGRFHAAIAAAVLRVPFSTWDSNTWKTRGLMQDIGLPQLHFQSQTEAIRNVPEIFDQKIDRFVESAQSKIETMFDTLSNIAKRNSVARRCKIAGSGLKIFRADDQTDSYRDAA
ncbi:polysaccharide pyruvyl transferase family protein [Mariniblastus fucicola]|uniref:Polysaccharide pyruvyl transferase n=1 Tax=Mariniblastus fucicola TaxID=980251 RepID=A0A5B9PNH1_9BACT|nr:polysaccharide pyruvyl transferase family protein [Mariniblastus fucicola]QEG24091.1 Polysaccharide pyruvyl transferase [Mariniblastus fucicola]